MTIGIVLVACIAARVAEAFSARMMLTPERTRSAASAGRRSFCCSAERSWMTRLRPSTQPRSARACRYRGRRGANTDADEYKRSPIWTGLLCCPTAENGRHGTRASASARPTTLRPIIRLRVGRCLASALPAVDRVEERRALVVKGGDAGRRIDHWLLADPDIAGARPVEILDEQDHSADQYSCDIDR